MKGTQRIFRFLCGSTYAGSMALVLAPQVASAVEVSSTVKAQLQEAYGKLPLSFEANQGQTDSRVRFQSGGPGYTLFLTPTEAVLALTKAQAATQHGVRGMRTREATALSKQTLLRLQLLGANPHPKMEGLEELPSKVSYFIGNERKKWRTGIPTYSNVKYHAVYPGVDLVYYGNQQQLEFDFIVSPGADPNGIRLNVEGPDRLEVDAHGDLVLHFGGGQVCLPKPFVYQTLNGARQGVSGGYVLKGSHQVSFKVAAYDGSRPLVIDPTLDYSTYLGGGSNLDRGFGVAVDGAGNAYVTGLTNSTNFPTTAGALGTSFNGGIDAFVTKLDPTGSALVYSTYVGGTSTDEGFGVAVDVSGNAYVTGFTSSTNFPTTAGVFDTSLDGASDAFVIKLDPAGSTLVYSTYLGGSGSTDEGLGVAVDVSGNAYVTGLATQNFPTTTGAFDTSFNSNLDAFVTKLDLTGAGLVYSTYLGGISNDRGTGITVDIAGNAYVSGLTSSMNFPTTPGAFDMSFNGLEDAFVTKLNPAGAGVVYSTYLGGDAFDRGFSIAVDVSGSAYVTGLAQTNFPTTAGAFDTSLGGSSDAFVTKLNPTGAGLVYSTYLGGSGSDEGHGIAVDAVGNAYVLGLSGSTNFPTTAGAFQTALGGGSDAFVTKLNPAGAALVYSTYLGGTSNDQGFGIAVDVSGEVYVTGLTTSTNFPTTAGAFDTTSDGGGDAFVAKISEVGAPATLSLAPTAATNPVNTEHCVTATVEDAFGNSTPDVAVRFSVTGSVTTGGSATTNDSGQATFCYTGPPFPGSDAITAYADTDADSTQDPGEPSGTATKTWILPPTTADCMVIGSGRITVNNGDRATFHGNARSSGPTGNEVYTDHGPATPMEVKSINVQAVVCRADRTQASVHGEATVDGSTTVNYLIEVKDLGEPGSQDTYRILLSNGYDSGEHTLEGGNIQIQ